MRLVLKAQFMDQTNAVELQSELDNWMWPKSEFAGNTFFFCFAPNFCVVDF